VTLEGKPLKKVSYALPHGAGIVSTTPEDLVRFWHGLLTGRLVSPSSVRTMCTDMFPVFGEEETHYGRGIMTYDVPGSGLIIGYGGRINGFRSVVGYLVDDGVYVTVLANDDAPVEAALHVLVRTVRAWRSRKG
jgi:D-alanyl-D-alanine carboxypeptidase